MKVIALVHEEPDSIPYGKSEQDPLLRERLQQFRERVASNRLVKFWKSADQLPSLVALSLANTIKTFPAVGWVRENRAANEDVLGEINELRKQNDQLQKSLAELTGAAQYDIPDLAALDDTMTFHGDYWLTAYRSRRPWTATLTWGKVFGYLGPYLDRHPPDDSVKLILKAAIYKESDRYDSDSQSSPSWDDQEFRTVAVQLKALGLVKIEYLEAVGGNMGLFWSLTPVGERLMMELRTIRKASAPVKS